jgi:hypothetical protein
MKRSRSKLIDKGPSRRCPCQLYPNENAAQREAFRRGEAHQSLAAMEGKSCRLRPLSKFH